MAHVARDQRNAEGLVYASRAVSHSKFPLHYFGYHVPHSSGLPRSSSYEAFGPTSCFTPERSCHHHGDNCATFTSPECGLSWPSVFLSPAKMREAAEEGLQLHNSGMGVQQMEHDRGITTFASGSPLHPCGLFASVADSSPCQHQHQQHELQRQVHKRCRDPQGKPSEHHSRPVSSRESGVRSCLARSANSFNAYRRSLLRLVLERGRRTLQQRRKRIRRTWNAKGSKHEVESEETSAQSGLSTGRSTGPVHPGSADHESRWVFLNHTHSPTNGSPRSFEFTRVENKLDIAHTNERLRECSALQTVAANGVQNVDFLPRSFQRQREGNVSAESVGTSVVSAVGVEGVQAQQFQTYTRKALTEGLSSTSPHHLQDIHLSLPQQDTVQSLPHRQASRTDELFSVREEACQYHYQPTRDTAVPPVQHEKDWFDGPCGRCSSNLTASVHAHAQLTSVALNADSDVQGTTKEGCTTVQKVEKRSTCCSGEFSRAPQKECWCCKTCNDKKAFFVGVPETNYACVDSPQLCLSNKCLFPSRSHLLARSTFPQNLQLLDFRGSIARSSTDVRSRKGHCLHCVRRSEARGEFWYSHACSNSLFPSNYRPGAPTRDYTVDSSQCLRGTDTLEAAYEAVQPVTTLSWKSPLGGFRGVDNTPPNQRIEESTPLAITSVCSGCKRLSGRSRSLGAGDSALSGVVHDIKAMRWISQEHLLVSVADALTELVDRSGSLHKKERNRKFDGIRCASIMVRDYFYRIAALCSCSCSCHLLALIYMDRLQQSVPNLFFDMLNIHRILLTSIMCAAKFYDDTFLSNAYYAMVGGISLSEMNRLEVRFLSMINFRLSVRPEQFGACLGRLRCISTENLDTYIRAHGRTDKEIDTPPRRLR